jgi:hypothetical protein
MRYGLFDTKDGLWLGDDHGPRAFDEDDVVNGQRVGESARIIARMAMEMTTYQLDWDYGRIEVRELPVEPWRFRDELPLRDTAEGWLRKKERGVIP